MKASVEYITPEQATLMLKNNPNNRKLSRSRVEKMAAQMERGAWTSNGSSIVMDGETLLDGQHRLSAIVKSGVTLPFVVVRNVDKTAFSSIDTGRPRSLSDVLHIRGNRNAHILSAALRALWNIKHGTTPYGFASSNLTHGEMSDFLTLYPKVKDSVLFVVDFDVRPPVPVSLLAALHAAFAEKDERLADRYIRAIGTGIGIQEGSVEAAVMFRLNGKFTRTNRSNGNSQAAAIIKGWNHLRAGTMPVRIQAEPRNGEHNAIPIQ